MINELQKVEVDDNTTYMIEKLVKKQTVEGIPGYIVKWYGWKELYNSFVPASEIKDIKSLA